MITAKIVDQDPKILFTDNQGREYEIDVSDVVRHPGAYSPANATATGHVPIRRTRTPLPELPTGTVVVTIGGLLFTKADGKWWHYGHPSTLTGDDSLFDMHPTAKVLVPLAVPHYNKITREDALREAGLL